MAITGEPAITRDKSKSTSRTCKPSTCLARITVSAAHSSSIVCMTGIIKRLGVTKQDGGMLNGHHSEPRERQRLSKFHARVKNRNISRGDLVSALVVA